ncbi:MAG TPA: hypothetical protein PK079_22940, partial [Leptospiraceae bacterium]|nr:hypothetical protein [Leptospiraceae bacterium]
AKTKQEKTALWFLFGITFDPETGIQEIYKIDPQSDYLEVLLVKEINHLEEHFLLVQPSLPLVGINIEESHQFYSRKKSFLKTVTEIAKDDKIKNKFVWNISSAYLNYTYSNFSEGDNYLAKAKTFIDKDVKNKLLYNSQFSIVFAYGKLLSNSKLTPSVEAEILPHLKTIFSKQIESIPNFRYDYPRFWISNAIAVRYASQGEYEKAEVVQNGTLRLHFSKLENTKKMISYFDRKDHSELEKFYQARSSLKKKHYQQLLGIHYALRDELELSLETFKSIPNYKYTFQTDPFAIRKKDCYECDILPKSAKKYDSIYFIQKLIDLKKEAVQNKNKQAENYFLVANAFYNMSFFGTSKFYRNDVHSFKQNYEMWQYSKFSKMDFPEMDNSTALKYYLLAASASNDPEFKAKMNFFAAKAELNEWHVQNKNYDKHFQSGLYYSILKKNFSNTRYYSEIIKECIYFARYINGK